MRENWNKAVYYNKKTLKAFKDLFYNEESRFRLSTTIKITLIPVLTFFIMCALIFIILKIDLLFFNAYRAVETSELKEVFFQYIIKSSMDKLPYAAVLLIILIFLGIYVSNLFLRPFKILETYCQDFIDGKKPSYDPDFFTDLKLLTRFSEYFFNQMENAKKNGKLEPVLIPSKYNKIHSPVFERDFFVQFSFLIVGTSIIMAIFLNNTAVEIHDGMINLANQVLAPTDPVKYFLANQAKLISDVMVFVAGIHVILYFLLAIHLYGKISAPAFGIFATMRAFLKGKHKQRVHLIGYYYLRPHCRTINKYLDYLEKNIEVKD